LALKENSLFSDVLPLEIGELRFAELCEQKVTTHKIIKELNQ
jgi:hypothetical protein